jgi:hypothetical protein
VRVRVLHLRLLAAIATILWVAAAAAVLLGYRPGGPLAPLVAATPLAGAIGSLAALAWPPVVRGRRMAAAVAWLGILDLLVLAPALGGLVDALAQPPATPFLPSPESAYAWFLALAGTALLAGLGVSRRVLGATSLRRTRLALGVLLATAVTAVGGGVSGMAVLATQLEGGAPAPQVTDWGPTDPNLVPPTCSSPLRIPTSASVTIEATSAIDGKQLGSVSLSGDRAGDDETWQAQLSGLPSGALPVPRSLAYTRVGSDAWLQMDGGAWNRVPLDEALTIPVEAGVPQPSPQVIPRVTLDTAVVAADLSDAARLAAEDAGIELVGGARARHCRLLTGGILALQGFRPLRWLIGQAPLSDTPDLAAWRGELDWWVFADGELGMATVSVEGFPPAGWPAGIQAALHATLTARGRGAPRTVRAP